MSGYYKVEVPGPGFEVVQLHLADLDDLYQRQEDSIRNTISPEEIHRAERFHKAVDRIRFMASRYLLRTVLAEFTGEDPGKIFFTFNPYGKPYLDTHTVFFNLSHSASYGVVALASDGEIGVDIETRMTLQTAREVAPRILTKREYETWSSCSGNERVIAFARYWTLKEAILKAYGEGLSQDPRSIDLDLGNPQPRILGFPDCFGPTSLWKLDILHPPLPYPPVALALKY